MKQFIALLTAVSVLLTTILSVFASDVDAQYDAAISLMSITNAESQFKIIKEDENGNPMPGISYDFAFYHTGYQGYLFAGSITTGADGTAMSKDYVFGDFIITEHPIDGYEPNDPLDIVIDKVGVIEVRFSSVKLIQGSVHVSVTEGNGMGIEGAIISIYTSDGLLTADIITDSGGMASYDGLSKGGYYAVVNSVPPGYLGYTDQYPFRIENDGKIEMLEMIVESVSGHAKIIVNDNFGNPLPRAVYGVYDNRNNFLEELMTGADGTVTSGRLHYGNYELRELLTVDGYEPMPEPVPFSIAQNDVIVEIPISRTAITGKVRATKTDGGGVPIPGVRYGIYGNQNILIEELTTGSDGAAMSGTLRYGAYELRELEAVSGYVPMPEPIPFNITEKGVTVEIPISGELIMGSVRLLKTDGDGVPIPGVKLTLYNNAGQIIQEFITGADGTATSISLVKGDYYLIETESAPGYVPITEPIPFSITVHNEVVEKTVVNNPGIGTLRVIALGESAAENGKGLIIGVRGVSADYIPIPGAKFDVYRGFNDENIAELTTGDDGAAEIELPLGEYYLEETFIPPAYKLPENSFPVAIMEHQATYELPVHNELVPKQPENGFVELTKKSTAGEPLANAVFGLYDAAGEVQITTLTTDTEGEAAYELQPGEYYFVELSAPDGYVLNSERVSFSVVSGETAAVTAFNEPDAPTPTQTGHIRLVKLMEGTGLFLEGAVFGVYEKGTDAQAGTLTTGEDGTATSAALPPAEYYLRELAAPAGFAPIPADVDVTVSAGNIAEIYIYNAPIPLTGYIRLTKLEEGTDRPLSGAVFGIYDASNDVRIAELATGADGAAVSGELAEGVYYLKEETVPDGYKVITEKMGVTVKGGETTEITIYNAKLPPHPPTMGFVRLTKKAEGTDAPLQGAVFGVYAVSGDIKTAELTTGADGTVTSGELAAGDYYLLELKAPDGYTPITDKIGATIKAGETAAVTVYNSPIIVEPPSPTAGYIQIAKKTEGTDAPLQGAVFGVYAVSGDIKTAELTTGADGTVTSGELAAGDYYLLELKAPDGYTPITDKIGVTVKAGETSAVIVYNVIMPTEPPPKATAGRIQLTKRAEGTYTLLKGAVFGVYTVSDDVKIAEMTTNAEGQAVSGELPANAYYLLELKAPDGYELNEDKTGVTVKAGETAALTVFNALKTVKPPIPTTGIMRLINKAQGTNAPLQGAVFGAYTAIGDIKTAEFTTDAEGKALSGELQPGDYYLLQHQAADGFEPAADKIGVTVKAGEVVEKVIFNAERIKTGLVRIVKRAEKTGELLPGAVFGIYNAVGDKKIAELTTGADGAATSESLPVGAYYLLEIQPPSGFTANAGRVYFTVAYDEIKEMTVTNTAEVVEKPINSYAKVITAGAGTGAKLAGAVFGLYKQGSDEKISELITGTDGAAVSAAVPEGNYYLLQLTASIGYKLNPDKINFSLNSGETKELTVINALEESPVPSGNLHLTVKAEATGAGLSGALFGIYSTLTNAKISEITTGADGAAVCELPEGSYYMRERQAPAGFIPEPSAIPFVIAAGNTIKVEVTNMGEKGGVRLTVKGADGSALAGAVLGVYNAGGMRIASLTTGADGKAITEVSAGVYYLLEESLPSGYTAGSDKYSFYVTAGQTADVLVMKQRSASPFYIPKTGEALPWLNYAAAMLCLCAAAVLAVSAARTRRRK